jgi:hypothetical protein
MVPGTPDGPIVAHTLALLPVLSGTRGVFGMCAKRIATPPNATN